MTTICPSCDRSLRSFALLLGHMAAHHDNMVRPSGSRGWDCVCGFSGNRREMRRHFRAEGGMAEHFAAQRLAEQPPFPQEVWPPRNEVSWR